jgi:hypothetical protein
MCLYNPKRSLYLPLGLCALALADIVHFVANRAHYEHADFVSGLMWGCAFGLLLLAIRQGRDGRARM